MPIKPVDFQVAIPRTTEASRISSNDVNKNINLQQQTAETLRDKSEMSLKQVYSRQKPEDAGIRERQRENRGRRQEEKSDSKGRQDMQQEAGNGKGLKGCMSASTIDIKI
jgi:hypothetical protein